MSESWRDILENAAGKLSIELEPIAAPAYSSAAAASFGPRRLSPQLSFAESRELLARELQAISVQSRKPRPPAPKLETRRALTVPVAPPNQKKQPVRIPRKRRPWQTILTTILSAAITGGLASYLLLAYGGVRKEEVLALAGYVDQGLRPLGEASGQAQPTQSPSIVAVVNGAKEDTLMESASYQANHGDGEGGRAVFELLANHGSARGAFALAETYDPVRLAQHPEWRLQPDLRLARQWYQKAAALGSAPAHDRLRDSDKGAASRP